MYEDLYEKNKIIDAIMCCFYHIDGHISIVLFPMTCM